MSKIELLNSSCADVIVDAVVNAANRNLVSGGGVCGAIYSKAGYEELNKACMKIKTPLKDGDAVITPAFNMKNAKYIIHAIGPDFNRTPNALKQLYEAYYNSLLVFKDNKLHSIAFPLISAGIFAGNMKNPATMSAIQCLKACNDFIKKNEDYDVKIKVCAYSSSEYQEIKDLF